MNVAAFWWSPARDLKLLRRELRRNPGTWFRLIAKSKQLPRNFGDELTPFVLRHLTGHNVRWAAAAEARFVATGSIIEYVAKRAHRGPVVWGSGLREPLASTQERDMVRSRLGNIVAVRGPNTRDALGLPLDTPVGDPGVLAPSWKPRQGSRRSGVVYIPHFRSWSSRAGREHLRRAQASHTLSVVPPTLPLRHVLAEISNADLVVSSSLHGLICAHSYGTPAIWVDIPGAGKEPLFKFRDYFDSLAVGLDVSPIAAVEALRLPNSVRDIAADRASRLQMATESAADRLAAALKSIASDL
ncbi:polysaccharide pyruvyl transferase family protein [Microbacterium horticulturae]|uniref:polysaccharide pyruvyl transferase family protein n=1 Tax=Microbacterium horticulturae TaxID=3028316 RepID=UPI003D173794